MKLFYYDTETTGVKHWRNGIHQISGCIEIDGEVKEYFDIKLQPNPACDIEDDALAIAGITRDDLKTYMSFSDGYKALVEIISKYVDKFNKTDKFFMVGYNNAAFDNQFMRGLFLQNGDNYFGSWFWANTIDVMVLATQKLLNERIQMVNFKQMTVAKQLGIQVDETKLHDAAYDIDLTRQIYRLCI